MLEGASRHYMNKYIYDIENIAPFEERLDF